MKFTDMSETELGEAKDPSTDPARLAELAASESPYVRGGVAGNPNTPVEVLSALASDQSLGVARDVARNPNASEEALTLLAGDSDVGVRILVAENPSTPMESLMTLSGDPDLIVRGAVGSNRSTPMKLLIALAGDENSEVRGGVVVNPVVKALVQEAEQSTDPARLAELADSAFPLVRVAAAQNHARSSVNEAEHPWTRPEPTEGADTLLTEAEDPVTDPSRLAEFDNAELDRLYVVAKYTYSSGRVNVMITENPITQSLASVELLYSFGGADDWLALRAAGILNGDVEARYDGSLAHRRRIRNSNIEVIEYPLDLRREPAALLEQIDRLASRAWRRAVALVPVAA